MAYKICYHVFVDSITEQGSEREISLGNSLKQLEKDYEESSFESDSDDDLDESEQNIVRSSSFSLSTTLHNYVVMVSMSGL